MNILEQTKFVPSEILDYVKKDYITYEYLKLKNINWDLYVYGESTHIVKKEKMEFIENLENIVSHLCKNGMTSLERIFERKITFYYYPTNFKKQIPKKKGKILYFHVNSGFTKKLVNQNYNVVIFRKEEIERTIIHELIHALEVHCAFSGGTIMSDKKQIEFIDIHLSYGLLCDNLRKSPKFLVLDEGVVETWATLIHCKLKKRSLQDELRYSIFQSGKLIKLLGFKTCEEFYKSKEIKTETNAFAYYILKSAFLMQIERFKEDFPIRLMFKCGLIKSSELSIYLENPKWVKLVDKDIRNYNNYPMLWKKSMRMTYP
jgi:hypothetical protein